MPILSTGIPSSVPYRRGFTLIELMVALAIMMIMTGIAVVAIGPSLRDARLRSGCRMVASACNYARSRAVSTNTSARVFFDQGRTVEVDTVALVDSTDPNSGTQAVPLTTAAGRYRYLLRITGWISEVWGRRIRR